jgi:hypothetical protein
MFFFANTYYSNLCNHKKTTKISFPTAILIATTSIDLFSHFSSVKESEDTVKV